MGLDEILDDQSFGTGIHNLNIGPGGIKSATWRRQTSLANFKPLLKFYSMSNKNVWSNSSTNNGLITPLPNDINILTLENWGENEILLRLENLNEIYPVQLKNKIMNIFHPRIFKKCHVVNLTGQHMIEITYRKSCNNVTLAPLEIRTFVLSWWKLYKWGCIGLNKWFSSCFTF